MDAATRNRLVLLAVAGCLLVGGGLLWVNTHKHEEEPTQVAMPVGVNAKQAAGLKLLSALPGTKDLTAIVAKTVGTSNQHAQQIDRIVDEGMVSGQDKQTDSKNPALKLHANGKKVVVQKTDLPVVAAVAVDTSQPTSRLRAATDARLAVGRPDPYEPLPSTDFKPFPRRENFRVAPPEKQITISKPDMVPPPPPTAASLVPAAKPEQEERAAPAPAHFDLGESLKLVAVIGNRAVLAFINPDVARKNSLPTTVSLGSGERFGPLVVVQINPDSVVLDEEGRRLVKAIQPIR